MKRMFCILLLDDHSLPKREIEQLGNSYEILLEEKAEQAVKQLKEKKKVDLLLMSDQIADMAPLEMIMWIRSIRQLQWLPFIVLDGRSDVEREVRALRNGVDDYLGGPFTSERISARIDARLKRLNVSYEERRWIELESVLTKSELQMAKYIIRGYTNQEISEELHYSYGYVKKCGSIILSKLHMRRRSDLRKAYLIEKR
ncbi:two-component response regulator [Lachnospiraceae bacterium KM106-2]|nr:two-component response regulator [Lachnospiraceae bacterium KM106-2]